MDHSSPTSGFSAIALVVVIAVVSSLVIGSTFVTMNQSANQTGTRNSLSAGSSKGHASDYVSPPVIQGYVPGATCVSSPGLKLQTGDLSLLGFVMLQNSSGSICVSYTFQPVDSQTNVNFQEYAYLFHVTATSLGNGDGYGYSYSKTAGAGISVIASPNSITLNPGTTTTQVEVQYTITTSEVSKGFFSLNYLDSCPAFIPFSVGYGTSSVNASDYHGFFLPSSCISMAAPIVGTPKVVGYGDMGTSLITASSETT